MKTRNPLTILFILYSFLVSIITLCYVWVSVHWKYSYVVLKGWPWLIYIVSVMTGSVLVRVLFTSTKGHGRLVPLTAVLAVVNTLSSLYVSLFFILMIMENPYMKIIPVFILTYPLFSVVWAYVAYRIFTIRRNLL